MSSWYNNYYIKKLILEIPQSRNTETMKKIIRTHVKRGNIIVSDAWWVTLGQMMLIPDIFTMPIIIDMVILDLELTELVIQNKVKEKFITYLKTDEFSYKIFIQFYEFIFPIINLGENKVYDNDFFSILSILKVIYKNNMIESKKKLNQYLQKKLIMK